MTTKKFDLSKLSKLDKELLFIKIGREIITAEDQSIIPDLGLLLKRTFMVMPTPMPDDMYERNMRRQIESGNPRFAGMKVPGDG